MSKEEYKKNATAFLKEQEHYTSNSYEVKIEIADLWIIKELLRQVRICSWTKREPGVIAPKK